MRDTMTRYMDQNQAGKSHLLGPSSVGKCFKQSAYQYLGIVPDRVDNKDKADLGTLLHLGWSALIAAMYDPKTREPDVRVTIPHLPRGGEADDVDWSQYIVTDLKSANARAWQAFIDRDGPYENYWDQVEIYAFGLWTEHPDPWTLRLVVINTETGGRVEFTRPADPKRGEAMAKALGERHAELAGAVRLVEAGADPLEVVETFPREGNGPGRGFPCDWCPFIEQCWPEARDGLSPQAVTVVDDPQEVEDKAGEYMDASQRESAAKKDKYNAQAYLKGIEGTFGRYKITTTGGRTGPDEPDTEAMVELLALLGHAIPMRGGVVRSSYPRVTRVKGA